MKKLFASLLTLFLIGWNVLPVLAAIGIKDVNKDFWAQKEINDVVSHKIMSVDENGNFCPDKSVTRVDFVQSLLKLLSNDHLDVKIRNSFTDVSETYPAYADILRSEQLGLVYGYPDKTFKPEKVLSRAETASILSHITKDKYTETSVLNQFSDKVEIPAWAVNAYAKTVHYGLYINYPEEALLAPNKDLTRAEAAVLLSRLRARLTLVKDEFKGKEQVLGVEHLNVHKKAPNNAVTITNLRKIIMENNVLSINYDQKFWSKKAQAGDCVNFVLKEALYTEEGTLLLPANTKFIAEVVQIIQPKWFNKFARVNLLFKSVVLPDGRIVPICAKSFTKDGLLKEGPWTNVGKLSLYTIGFGGIGAGAGVGFAFIPSPAKLGTGFAIGIPVGCAVGLATGLVTKGWHYKAKVGEKVYILLEDSASIYNN